MLLVTVLYQSNNSTFYRPGKQGLFISAQQTNQSSALHQERRVFKRTKSCATWNRDSPAVTPPWEIKEQQKVPSYSSNPENLSGYGEHWTWLLLRKVFGTLDKAKTGGMRWSWVNWNKTTGKWKLLAALFVAPQTNKRQSHQIVVFPAGVQILPFC